MTNPHIGSSFDDFLRDQGILTEATDAANRRILEWCSVPASSVETFRKIHASSEFTTQAAHDAFAAARRK